MSMNIHDVWKITYGHLDTFTSTLERDRTFAALEGVKPLWRIMKSIQLKYLPDLDPELSKGLERAVERLNIVSVTPSSFTEEEAMELMIRFGSLCAIDDMAELEEPETEEQAQPTP